MLYRSAVHYKVVKMSVTHSPNSAMNSHNSSPKTPAQRSPQKPQDINIKSLERIGSLPVIESATALYSKVKDSNFLLRWGLKPAEMSFWLAIGSTKPFIAFFPTPVHAVDYIVCASLDVITQNIPVVTYPPDLVYNMTKDFVTSTFVSPVLKRADSVKQISLTVANKGGELASTRLNNAIDVAEKYIDIYLPDTTDGPEDGDGKAAKTFNHMNRFGRKLQRRITRRTIAEAQALKQQGLDTIHCIIYLADLLAKDPRTFMEKTKMMWKQLSEDEPENQIPPANLEQLINMLIREMARRVVHLTNYLAGKGVTLANYGIHFGHIALLNIVYWADYMIKILHLQFIPDAISAKYDQIYNYYVNLFENMLTFIRQLNLESGHPALIPTPTPVRAAHQPRENVEISPRSDESTQSTTESQKVSPTHNGASHTENNYNEQQQENQERQPDLFN